MSTSLVSENLEMVLPTLVSRTQNLRIGKIQDDEMKKWISELKPEISQEELQSVLKSADGNPLKAIKSMENNLISTELIDFFINWARLTYKAYEKMPDLIKCSEDLASRSRDEQNQILHYGVNFFRNALLLNNQAQDLTYIERAEKDHVKNFAPLINVDNSARLTTSFEKTIGYLDRYANAKVLFLDLSIDFARNINAKNVNL